MAKQAKRISGIIILILAVMAVIVLSSSLVVTAEDEYTIIKRFNKIERVIDEAGLTFKTPFVETVDKLPKSLQLYDMPTSDVITVDKRQWLLTAMYCGEYRTR